MAERLQKILSHWGVASRRQAEAMIQAGRVTLNGQPALLGQKADPAIDRILVDGQQIRPHNRPDRIYLLLNKPLNIVTTCDDPQHRQTVIDLLPAPYQQGQGIHPVGRLDANSTGALLLTNDGELTFALTHPRHHVPKTYWVTVEGHPADAELNRWRRGVLLDGRQTRPATVSVIQRTPTSTQLKIVLQEGRKRQIRRVGDILGHPVIQLHRVAIGSLELDDLPPGQFRRLESAEVQALQRIALLQPHPSDTISSTK
ncbi:MAG: pseudouridine synthase [Thainema sp.]